MGFEITEKHARTRSGRTEALGRNNWSTAYKILSSMNDQLCNPDIWSTTAHDNGVTAADSSRLSELGGGGAFDEARLRYKSSIASLRNVLTAILSSRESKTLQRGSNTGQSAPLETQSEVKMLERRVANMRMEPDKKNKYLKLLINQLRELITDISTWQSPCTV